MFPLAAVTRSGYVESIHFGYLCVSDSSGKIIYNLGDENTSIYFRSSAKPIQALPLIKSGAAAAFGLSKKEISLACASHSGQEVHQRTTTEILSKLNLQQEHLHCGIMQPYNEEENSRLKAANQQPTVLHCSCSGKHAGMLTLAKFRGYSLENYESMDHPVQQEVMQAIADFTDTDMGDIPLGVDGCGVPIYLLPMNKIAMAYARLVYYAEQPDHPYHQACKVVFEAMNEYPEMVAGDYEFDTELMKRTSGKLVAKVGCEAVYCIGIREKNLGVCIKIIDGNERAVYPVVMQLLIELGILDKQEHENLKNWHKLAIKNNLEETIGEVVPIFHRSNTTAVEQLLGKRISGMRDES